MDNYYKELIKSAHNAQCPVCGAWASVVFIGDVFDTITCCHDEAKKLVADRIGRVKPGFDPTIDG